MITLEGGGKTVSPTKVISLITTAVAALSGTILLALLLALNPGHSSRVRSAWSEWYLHPTAENKKHLDLVETKVNREYNFYRLELLAVILLNGYIVYRSFLWYRRSTQSECRT